MRFRARPISRRQLLYLGAVAGLLPAWAGGQAAAAAPPALSGEDIRLTIGHSAVRIDGRAGHGVTINGTAPGPLIRLREGQNVRLHVTNTLDEDTSIHWHGLLVPFQMDGVPGVSFPGIKPGETSSMNSPSGSPEPTGITATRACRSRRVITPRSSSIRRAPIPSPMTASM